MPLFQRNDARDAKTWDILDRHFDEAEFLAELWRDAFEMPDITLDELAGGIESRLLAHLDALAIAGRAMMDRTYWPTLSDPDVPVSLALVAGLGVLAVGDITDLRRMTGFLSECAPHDERWRGIVEALALSRRSGLDAWLCEQPIDAGVVSALALRNVRLGGLLTELLSHEDVDVLSAAARLARWGDAEQLRMVGRLADHSNPQVAAAASETALVCGLPGAVELARYWAFSAAQCEFRSAASCWVGLLGHPADQLRIAALLDDPARRREALWALAFGGAIGSVDAVMPLLADSQFGPLAAEVITMIAGLPTDDESLWREAEPNDDLSESDDEHLGLDPERLLPTPNSDAVREWWRANCSKLAGNTRLLAGMPLDDAVLARALARQPMRRRHPLALFAQLRNPSAPHLCTRTWAHEQLGHPSSSSGIA